MSVSEFLNNEFTFLTGLIITIAAIAGIFYRGLTWLRTEVTKENKAIREHVITENKTVREQLVSENKTVREQLVSENKKIKEEAIDRISQNRTDIQNVENTLSKELQYNNTLISTKLDNMQLASKEYKMQLENYSKDIGRTVTRNDSKVNDHEIRISIMETKVDTIKPDIPNINRRVVSPSGINRTNVKYHDSENNDNDNGDN